MKWWLASLACLLILCLPSCMGSKSLTGVRARRAIDERLEQKLPASVTDTKFKYVWVRDSYSEYITFRCPPEYIEELATSLGLNLDPAFAHYLSTSTNPNSPPWWKPATSQTMIYAKRDWPGAPAGSSTMLLWYNAQDGAAYMDISFID